MQLKHEVCPRFRSGRKVIKLTTVDGAGPRQAQQHQAARKLLDRMYTKLDAEKVAAIMERHAPPVHDKAVSSRYLFTVVDR